MVDSVTEWLNRCNKNGAQSFNEFPQKEIMYVRKYQKWETTKGYQQTKDKFSSTPSFFLGLIEVPLLCGAQD